VAYQRIVAASFRDGDVIVEFADGAKPRLSPRSLVAPGAPEPDWSRLRAAEFHLIVPAPDGELEIPWDVIRVNSDPAYDAFWSELAAEPIGSGARSDTERAG
jgi:hypothetical protein